MGDLRHMLRRKRELLTIDGRAHVLVEGRFPGPAAHREVGQCTESDVILVDNSGVRPWFEAGGEFGQFTFTRDLHTEELSGDMRMAVDVPLASLQTEDDLVWALSELSALGWTTPEGHWSLLQQHVNWHGAGAAALAQAIRHGKDRYDGLAGVHRIEELTYQDQCDGGFYTLTADIDRQRGGIAYTTISMQLAGVPFDPHRLDELCRTFEVTAPIHFVPRSADPDFEGSKLLRGREEVTPLGLLIREPADAEHGQWVCGLLIENPWRLPEIEPDLPPAFRESEVIVCELREWHQMSGSRIGYRLERCRWIHSSDALIIKVSANWFHVDGSRRVLRARSSNRGS